jgi:hypothetical protein
MLREILAMRRQAWRETGPERNAAFDDAQDKAREGLCRQWRRVPVMLNCTHRCAEMQ